MCHQRTINCKLEKIVLACIGIKKVYWLWNHRWGMMRPQWQYANKHSCSQDMITVTLRKSCHASTLLITKIAEILLPNWCNPIDSTMTRVTWIICDAWCEHRITANNLNKEFHWSETCWFLGYLRTRLITLRNAICRDNNTIVQQLSSCQKW